MITNLVFTLTFFFGLNFTPVSSTGRYQSNTIIMCLWVCLVFIYGHICGGTYVHMCFVEDRRETSQGLLLSTIVSLNTELSISARLVYQLTFTIVLILEIHLVSGYAKSCLHCCISSTLFIESSYNLSTKLNCLSKRNMGQRMLQENRVHTNGLITEENLSYFPQRKNQQHKETKEFCVHIILMASKYELQEGTAVFPYV